MAPGHTGHPALADQGGPSPILSAAATAARTAWLTATAGGDRGWLLEQIGIGADGTPTSRIDVLVESAVLATMEPHRVNILSEEAGWIDRGAALTLVMDPVDGTGNAAAGVPVSAFTAALAIEDRFVEGLTLWFDGDRTWWAHVDDERRQHRSSGRRRLDGAMVSMVSPKPTSGRAFLAVADRADRVRVLGCSSVEAALVASGGLDVALDPGSDTHRLVDLAAAVVLLEAAGGVVVDVDGRPVTFSTAMERRWSGVCAATPELAEEVVELVRGERPGAGRPADGGGREPDRGFGRPGPAAAGNVTRWMPRPDSSETPPTSPPPSTGTPTGWPDGPTSTPPTARPRSRPSSGWPG